MAGAPGRWFRLNTTWSQSEWVADLPPAGRLAWVELLSYVKAHGFDGRARIVSCAVFGRMVDIPPEDIYDMLDAAVEDGALKVDGDEWVVVEWRKDQGPPRPPSEQWAALRSEVFARDDYTCTYCGSHGVRLECDHIIPVARGGGHEPDNLTTSCFTCNRSKRDKLVAEWRPDDGA